MSEWRSLILKEFQHKLARLIIVADPDELLTEAGILQGIQACGYDVIAFEDSIAFRYIYETKYRALWDKGSVSGPWLALRLVSRDCSNLPFDLLKIGRQLSFSLSDLFPNLSSPVVASLERGDFDELYRAQEGQNPGVLGDNATKDFALRHVFEIAPELIKQPSDLLRVLLRRHYRSQRIPYILDQRLIELLRMSTAFKFWPLDQIIPDREAFFQFLQERWPAFVDSAVGSETLVLHEPGDRYGALAFAGPIDLPFDHDDIKIYMDNLFFEGILHPIKYGKVLSTVDNWVKAGLCIDAESDQARRFEGLLNVVNSTVPVSNARYQDWLAFAYRWAELTALGCAASTHLPEKLKKSFQDVRNDIDKAFSIWLSSCYAGLYNQPPSPPVMIHHIPRYLARDIRESQGGKIALLVIDGLALDQWTILREVLQVQRKELVFRESAVFAIVPTITSVSRQALFAGKAPFYFQESIWSTEREPTLWTSFWADHDLSPTHVAYLRGLGDGKLDELSDIASHPGIRVLGLVIDIVDRIMHGMELGAAGMHNQIRQWALQGYLTSLLTLLLDNGYAIVLTSDHGNMEATGIGCPREGAIADKRGERARIYSDIALRSRVKEKFPDTVEWQSIGLPDNFLALLAPDRSAFIQEGKNIVGHGGACIEEVIIPFIRIERRSS